MEDPVIIHYVGPIKPWVNRYWVHADEYWKYEERTPYYDQVKDIDPTVTMRKKFKFEQRVAIWFCKNFGTETRRFRIVQKAAWFYSKIAGRFTVL